MTVEELAGCAQVVVSHTRTVLSAPEVASSDPSGLNDTTDAGSVIVWSSSPFAGFNTWTVLSAPAVARSAPFGLNVMFRRYLKSPVKVCSGLPVEVNHSRIVLSFPAVPSWVRLG